MAMITDIQRQSSGKDSRSFSISPSTKILFLDFDGVCNSYSEGSYVTHKNDEYGPSKTICERIRKICESTGAKIIISSNWRRFPIDGKWFSGKTFYRNPLLKLYEVLGDLIVGTLTPERHITKAEALCLWFEDNRELDKWVVVDDDPRENLGLTSDYGIKDHYIQTEPEFGITEEVSMEIVRRLSRAVYYSL